MSAAGQPLIHEVAHAATLSYTSGSTGPVTATCPAGEFALGGGWSVPSKNRVFAAKLTGNTWSVSVTNPGIQAKDASTLLGSTPLGALVPTPPGEVGVAVTVYVECLANVSSATVTQTSGTAWAAGGNALDIQSATCTGSLPVGFGFDLSASATNLELMATNPETFESAAWWNFWVRNHDAVAHQVSFSAVCLSNLMAVVGGTLKKLSIEAAFPGKQGGYVYASMTGTVTAPCPAGMLVAGGGLNYGDLPDVNNVGIGNTTTLHAVSNGWQGSIYGVTGVGLYPLIASSWAVCVALA